MSTPTPRTDERTYPANCLGQTPVVHAAWAQALERDLADAQVENLKQARLLGMSGERECDLRGKVRELERDLAAARAEVARLREESLRGHWDDYSSIKEGQREIAELRAEAEHLKGSEKSFCEDRNAWRARAERAEAEVETLREALAFIAKHGGISHDTEEGTIYCNGPWCAEQARAALDAARAKGGRS